MTGQSDAWELRGVATTKYRCDGREGIESQRPGSIEPHSIEEGDKYITHRWVEFGEMWTWRTCYSCYKIIEDEVGEF